ncbi:aminodeoxychorismate lyase [candidate division TM7 genomosp. GTL1]|nr:aminodeoxychorismate lyase [candidate division TM7 genomosp. GTL1]
MVSNAADWRSTQLPSPVSSTSSQPVRAASGSKKPRKRRLWLWIIVGVILFLAVAAGGAFWWYQNALAPHSAGNKDTRRIQVEQGETVAGISAKLEQEGIISSALAFQIYTQLSQSKNNLQAGAYAFSPSQSVQTIVGHLVEGKVDSMMVTILPGSTIRDIQKSLQEKYGFSPAEVEEAFTAQYSHPLLAKKPKGASLEGYIYPETYLLNGNESVKSLLERSFDEMQKYITEKKLEPAFKKRKLSLHQAITLASIVQQEVISEKDMKQVAQIFYRRLAIKMPLGADATFIYGAEVLGVEPRVNLNSPYNTRIVKGLPPGPIGNASLMALEAVAHPAKGNYLYFVSGDDGTTYYSRSLKEHEQKTAKYCRKNCAIFDN